MPHAIDAMGSPAASEAPELAESQDEADILTSLLSNEPVQGLDADIFNPDREFDQTGKADNAVDYEDIDDDDLADDDDALMATTGDDTKDFSVLEEGDTTQADADMGYEDDPGDALDDLFGDDGEADLDFSGGAGASNTEAVPMSLEKLPKLQIPGSSGASLAQELIPGATSSTNLDDLNDEQIEEEQDAATREQQRLIAEARANLDGRLPPAPPEDQQEFLETAFPNYEPSEPALFFRLFPHKKAYYRTKHIPPKPPKPIQPTKISLDLSQDQEKTFLLTHSTALPAYDAVAAEKHGLIMCAPQTSTEVADLVDLSQDVIDDNERIGGLSMGDITMLCADWNIETQSVSDDTAMSVRSSPSMTEAVPDWDARTSQPQKRRKLETGFLPVMYDEFPSLEDPEATTAYLSRNVPLDLNDPKLLLVQHEESVAATALQPGSEFRKDVSGSLMKSMIRKYNISNDEAYDRLKDNHSHKIRSTIGNLTVEHGMPAIKLQFPFYKVKLNPREARSFHRPVFTSFKPNQQIRFVKRGSKKRKDMRPLPVKEAYDSAKQLTFNDNADVALFEYSEEYPMLMSSFSMGSKLVNYYRRRDETDNDRPKYPYGETQVLLPQDKSPFSIFGNIEPGEHQPTLHNSMFRAPVWLHQNKSTDFIIGCSRTGEFGQQWFLRNMQSTFVVGQQFPSVEVPGTHARKVTEAAKRRLKMISWRIWRRHAASPRNNPSLTNDEIRKHLPGTDIPQNRSKMREFMNYDKETSTWKPSAADPIPADLAGIRALLRPEDICLLDAMQVGHRHLLDAGYNKDDPDTEEGDEDDGDKDGESLEQQLAPWQLTKNFLNACQSKAMLELHGEGDPSGRGEAFSFIKTSMKGGFKAVGESIEDKLDAKRLKELGGHSYNVARQQKAYEIAIKHIWEAQRSSLSADAEHSDFEPDVDDAGGDEGRESGHVVSRTPRSEIGTPGASAMSRRGEDDSASAFSHYSSTSQRGKVLRITRYTKEKGKEEPHEEVINDPAVIRAYMKRRKALELANITDFEMTGDPEVDALKRKAAEKELARLHRNKERRHAREKAKGKLGPDDGEEGGRVIGTQRKCANCGQVGHIKTNKKYCEPCSSLGDTGPSASASFLASDEAPQIPLPSASQRRGSAWVSSTSAEAIASRKTITWSV